MTGDESSRARILAVAEREFAERGFAGARLQAIAEGAGLSHPTLIYYFGSKEALYTAVIAGVVEEWAAVTERAVSTGLRGFDQLAAIVEAAVPVFAEHRAFVAIVRREALEGGERLERAMGEHLRPLFGRAVAFLEREVAAGRLRPHDPVELMQLCYGAVLTYVSDAALRRRLEGQDPLAPAAVARFRDALLAILRAALEPARG
jgi:TetR/AcrR family transcriptional regulator